ncbi:MAG: hypothetical protein CBD60_00630 [Flavobacteriaceae bacterium TMED200]|nr:hypothetical protein [Flavobacteriaceae bacterium]OUW66853.1 MAG: hypothetical protein CBD60_00630 [Flavobacteriaceae bacterium TMED200]
MHIKATIFIFFIISIVYSQENKTLLNSLFDEKDIKENEKLLPERMVFTQSILWGEKGIFRKIGISRLNKEQRVKELKIRKVMLKSHQIIGYLTLAGMIAQGILGGKLYNNWERDLYNTHKTVGNIVTASYFTGAGLSLFAPPPLVNKKVEGFNSIKAHKILATIHFSGMVATNYFSKKNTDFHKYSAYTTFASYFAAVVVFKFK